MSPGASEVDIGEPQPPAATILLVEDEVLTRLALAEFLRDCGYVVLEAANALEAQAVLLSEPDIDVVFSDIQMPGVDDGIRLEQWVRSNFPALPVILASGNADSLAAARSICGNVQAFLPKPFTHDLALEHIRGAIERRASR